MANVLIIGAGGVAHVAAHKCAQNNDILGDICIASRTVSKCEGIIDSINRKNSVKDRSKNISAMKLDALKFPHVVKAIEDTGADIVINLGSVFINMTVLEACIKTGASYIDTAIHEEPDRVATICEPPPWYANYEWKRREQCREKGVSAILGIGFDPGVVNAYAALAAKELLDQIYTIDIMDVNAGNHGKYFATNFDPEVNFREFTGDVWAWENRHWKKHEVHSVSRVYAFPEIGPQKLYLTGHDEIHSLSQNISAETIRFWMGFSDHYINVFNVLNNVGLLSEKPVVTAEGDEVIPLKVVKACLPDPKSLAPGYVGQTCIGDLITGVKNGVRKELFIYNVCDHAECYREVESQAISYTAGVPAAAAAILLKQGVWNPRTMVNVEELDPNPLIGLLDKMGLPSRIVSK